MTVRGAALLGIGAMVGAGIFALLGEAGAVAGAAVWISFLLAGIVSHHMDELDPELFDDLHRLTLQLQPSFRMRQDLYENLPLTQAVEHFDEITASADSVRRSRQWSNNKQRRHACRWRSGEFERYAESQIHYRCRWQLSLRQC